MDCTCGVYAAKALDRLSSIRFWNRGIRGEAWLWGAVVEHERGWRAQFAYPKTLFLPAEALPVTLAEIRSRLESLVAYGCDIFVVHDGASVSLWRKDSGLEPVGLGFLLSRGKEWYARRRQQRTVERGDRVAVLGRGIAVVEQAEGGWIRAVLWNRDRLRIRRRDIVWDEGNMRWEASPQAHSPRF